MQLNCTPDLTPRLKWSVLEKTLEDPCQIQLRRAELVLGQLNISMLFLSEQSKSHVALSVTLSFAQNYNMDLPKFTHGYAKIDA